MLTTRCMLRMHARPHAEDGTTYWWRANPDDDDDPEVSLTDPEGPGWRPGWAFRAGDEGSAEVWRVAELPDGTRYLWRPNPEDEDDPETQFWVEGALESGAPYWYDNADPEKISLTDPFEAGWEGPED